MLPKDLLKYLEKRDDTIKDLKNARSQGKAEITFRSLTQLSNAFNPMWSASTFFTDEIASYQQFQNQQRRP